MPSEQSCGNERIDVELGQHTKQEILSQPEAWAATLETLHAQVGAVRDFYRAGQYQSMIFTGCGSTYYLSLAAAALLQELTGTPARGLPASEVWLCPRSALSKQRTLLIAVSRSGETTETLRACESFRASGGDVLALSCYPGRELTKLGTVNLVFPAGQENSIAQTRAFTTLYLATVALSAIGADRNDLLDELDRLPDVCRRLLADYGAVALKLGTDAALDRFYFLGSGPRYGLACELNLKMKEMSLSHSEPFHFMEFRHGPKSMVTPSTLMVGLVSEANRAHEMMVLDEMRQQGAQVLALGEREADVAFASQVSEAARDALYLPVGQLLAFERAVSRGLDPDRPHNLDAVVKLNAAAAVSARRFTVGLIRQAR
jgi:glucosamine--fructose-6-phosphate aminotransferase (isomerizing)